MTGDHKEVRLSIGPENEGKPTMPSVPCFANQHPAVIPSHLVVAS